MAAKENTFDKTFDPKKIFFGLDCKEIPSYGQKCFREMNNPLCKVGTGQTIIYTKLYSLSVF